MRRFLLPLAAVCALAVTGVADAQIIYRPYSPSRQYHNDLQYRKAQRQAYSDYAHQFPMTPQQHERLHDELDREEFNDHLEHKEFHRRYDSPYSGGYHLHSGHDYHSGHHGSHSHYSGHDYYGGHNHHNRPRSGFIIVTPRFSFGISR